MCVDEMESMIPPELNDGSLWESIVFESSGFIGNLEGAEHFIYRFMGQYLPAIMKGRSEEGVERAWLALWSYMIARRSARKPFTLSHDAADDLINRLKMELERITTQA